MLASQAWFDPFLPPLNAENEEFVWRSGKWTAYDVSAEPPYHVLVGEVVSRVEPRTRDGKVVGVRLDVEPATLVVDVDCDETLVAVELRA